MLKSIVVCNKISAFLHQLFVLLKKDPFYCFIKQIADAKLVSDLYIEFLDTAKLFHFFLNMWYVEHLCNLTYSMQISIGNGLYMSLINFNWTARYWRMFLWNVTKIKFGIPFLTLPFKALFSYTAHNFLYACYVFLSFRV